VEPHLLARSGDRWYLVARCQEGQAPRGLRWDRIEAVLAVGPVRGHRRESASAGDQPTPQGPVPTVEGQWGPSTYSHSMVPGGLLVTSRVTRLTSGTSLVMRVEILASTS
jgi:hypothetical protein